MDSMGPRRMGPAKAEYIVSDRKSVLLGDNTKQKLLQEETPNS